MSAVAGRVLLIPKGSYNSGITYNMLDVVTYEYDSYVAKTTTIGHDPTDTTYWQKMTDVGDDVNSLKETLTNFEESITGEVVDSKPYVLRQGLGNLADMALVGGSVAWNQLCNGSSVTVPNGHKYYMRKSGTTSIGASTGSAITGLTSGTDNVIDLTQLFGTTTIADYIYALEQATAGAGVAWFRKYFPNDYYGYQRGKIESVNPSKRVVEPASKNIFDVNAYPFTNNYYIHALQGIPAASTTGFKCTFGYVPCFFLQGKTLTLNKRPQGGDVGIYFYDANKENISGIKNNNATEYTPWTFTVPNNAVYMRFTVPINATDIQIEIGSESTAYVPYKKLEFPFDSSKQLRGVPKLVDNKLSYDGDIYKADGSVTRKYGIVDLGSLAWIYNSNYARMEATAPTDAKIPSNTLRANAICGKYLVGIASSVLSIDKTIALGSTSYNVIMVYDSSYTDATTFKTAMSGVYLVYELATPTTESANAYQNPQRAFIDGTEEFIDAGVTAGTRDVSIPVGNNTTYQLNETLPPTEDYVDGALKFKVAISALGTDESGRTTASRTYTAGEFFYKDGKMYKVLTSIAQGATFTINTNCQQTTLFAELKALAQ